MQTEPLISVIVPVYNVAPYLELALDSIRYQSYQNLEIILISVKILHLKMKDLDTFIKRMQEHQLHVIGDLI
ncbi:glycosyltransferase [Streptococcus mitis]|uniref:glycosyltransferase n=1 Tax=Streptococcus mitis TaxID=28037 RepID=UPI0039C2E279